MGKQLTEKELNEQMRKQIKNQLMEMFTGTTPINQGMLVALNNAWKNMCAERHAVISEAKVKLSFLQMLPKEQRDKIVEEDVNKLLT